MTYAEYRALPMRPRAWLAVRLLKRLGKYTSGMSARELTEDEAAKIDAADLAAMREVFPHALSPR
jgi:hypothetical protein